MGPPYEGGLVGLLHIHDMVFSINDSHCGKGSDTNACSNGPSYFSTKFCIQQTGDGDR